MHLAVYGKGGIGKSMVASNLSAAFAMEGRRILHVGCDPKGDSTRNLLPDPIRESALDRILDTSRKPAGLREVIHEGRLGIHCIEAGGPEPGEGCGGMGILRLFQLLEKADPGERDAYDVNLYDILGDVVCGGFAVPMRFCSPVHVLLVVSEEVYALYAANQIARAVARYHDRGTRLAGLVLNRRSNQSDTSHVHRFAQALGTRVLIDLPRSERLFESDLARLPVLIHSPDAGIAQCFRDLARLLLDRKIRELPEVHPLSPAAFDRLLSGPGLE